MLEKIVPEGLEPRGGNTWKLLLHGGEESEARIRKRARGAIKEEDSVDGVTGELAGGSRQKETEVPNIGGGEDLETRGRARATIRAMDWREKPKNR